MYRLTIGEPGSLVNVAERKAEKATSWEERPSKAGEDEELACDDMAGDVDGSASMLMGKCRGREEVGYVRPSRYNLAGALVARGYKRSERGSNGEWNGK